MTFHYNNMPLSSLRLGCFQEIKEYAGTGNLTGMRPYAWQGFRNNRTPSLLRAEIHMVTGS